MRIRKTSQTTTTSAQLLNSYSTSQTSGYACDYINRHFQSNAAILWQNSNPTNSFGVETITLSSSDYDILELVM